MIRTCEDCQKEYDDALCMTFCPHPQFITEENAKRKDLAALKAFDSRKTYRVKGTEIVGQISSINYLGYVSIHGHSMWETYDPYDLEEVA